MKKLLPLLLFLILISACRKYRIEHTGCKEDAFIEGGLFMPNIFTPSGDGINDRLIFHHGSIEISNFSIKIKNAASIKVFETSDPNFEWDGWCVGGKKCKLDVYKYEMCFDASGKHYHIVKRIVIDYTGDKSNGPNACPAQFNNCAFSAQWDGARYNPQLPTNEFFGCE